MALKIIIEEICQEDEAAKKAKPKEELPVGWLEDDDDEETGIVLTEHIIENCVSSVQNVSEKNEFLSMPIHDVAIEGKFNVADPSEERKNINIFFDWHKERASKKETYKKIGIKYMDANGMEFKNAVFEKSFIVDYVEKGSFRKGTIEFNALVRSLDKTNAKLN